MTALREITTGGLVPIDPGDVRAGAVPQLGWIKIADLVIDDRFQRPLNKSNWAAIGRIAAAFSWGKFAPVVAAPIEGGRYALIDGQHRTHAAHLCGFESVPAMIVVLTPAAQAASFAAINGNVTHISTFHVYKAALAAGEHWAEACRDAVAAAGCELMTYNRSSTEKKPGQVYSVALIRRYVTVGKGAVVTRGLAAIAAHDWHHAEHFTDRVLDPWFAAIDAVPGGGARPGHLRGRERPGAPARPHGRGGATAREPWPLRSRADDAGADRDAEAAARRAEPARACHGCRGLACRPHGGRCPVCT